MGFPVNPQSPIMYTSVEIARCFPLISSAGPSSLTNGDPAFSGDHADAATRSANWLPLGQKLLDAPGCVRYIKATVEFKGV